MRPEPPTGRQYTIVAGDDRATVVEVGAGLRSYVAGGRELLDGYGEHDMPSNGRGHVLVPWPNRLADGRYRWDGVEHQTPLTEPAKGNAIHGLVRYENWRCVSLASARVELAIVVHPRPGYPFTLDVRVAYALGPDGLTVTTTARNVGTAALPFAAGHHPYIAAGSGVVDDCSLRAPGATVLPTDDRGLPLDPRAAGTMDLDFRAGVVIGDRRIDHALTDLERDGDGLAWVQLRDATGRGAAVWLDAGYPYLQLFTGDTVSPPERRRRGLAVEPMTAPPNAFASGVGVRRLEPGEVVAACWGIRALDNGA